MSWFRKKKEPEQLMTKRVVIVLACLALALVNIASFKYLGVLGFFVTAASFPFAERLLDMINALP